MKILGIESFGVRGVPDGNYDFAKRGGGVHDLVLVTGDAGSGKTRLLELLVGVRESLAPSDGSVDEQRWVRDENRSAKALVTWLLSDEEQRVVGVKNPIAKTEVIFGAEDSTLGTPQSLMYLFERYDHDDATPKIEYFAENRRLDVGGGEMATDPEARSRFRGSKSPRKYAWIPTFLSELRRSATTRARFAATLAKLSPSCRYDDEEKRLTSRGRPLRSLAELSASEADAVLFAATASLVGLSGSVLLVDRPELFASPPADIIEGLAALGTDNQLILATSRPDIAGDRPHAMVRLDAGGVRLEPGGVRLEPGGA